MVTFYGAQYMADSGMILSFPSEWRDVQNTKTADRAIY
jgi:hypothetical protein